MDHANLCHALARRAAVAEGLKEREVSPVHHENDEKEDADGPVCRDCAEDVSAGIMIRASRKNNEKARPK